MSSLQYSSWDAGDTSTKKKIPSFGKPLAPPPKLDVNDLEIREGLTNLPNEESAETKQNKIHELLEKMNQENFQDLTAVEPLPPPVLIQKSREGTEDETRTPHVATTASNSRVDALANYRTAYSGKMTYQPEYNVAHQGRMKGTVAIDQNILLEKLNHMIYLLEQQQNEKTDNILEEFILYCFLGVFIIYVVDAFARSGNNGVRYVR